MAVPDDATAVLGNERVRTLVSDAVATDGRVDYLPEDGPVDEDARLVFGAFDRIRFRGETYDPTSSYAGFAEEATYVVEAVAATESETTGEVLVYGNLTDGERDIADELVVEGDTSPAATRWSRRRSTRSRTLTTSGPRTRCPGSKARSSATTWVTTCSRSTPPTWARTRRS
ncbi:hypothetical protein [Haloarchaeobius iranensis]|uniref:hypothetical protein n=1 Tax=Haloarchaeobius iranensis TaxID=996166 RepID=UPI000B7C784B|nr:hypothetical protein [Haloarchaeobius iranensis]